MIEYGYKKAYIEEVREASGDVMAELDFLNDFMTQNDGWKKVYNESYCEWSLSLNKKQKLKKIHTKELQEEYLA